MFVNRIGLSLRFGCPHSDLDKFVGGQNNWTPNIRAPFTVLYHEPWCFSVMCRLGLIALPRLVLSRRETVTLRPLSPSCKLINIPTK